MFRLNPVRLLYINVIKYLISSDVRSDLDRKGETYTINGLN